MRYTQIAPKELLNLAARAGQHHRGGARPVRNVEVRLGEATIRELVESYNDSAQSTDLLFKYGLSKGSVLNWLFANEGVAVRMWGWRVVAGNGVEVFRQWRFLHRPSERPRRAQRYLR